MSLKLIDNEEGLKKLESYFSFHLRGTISIVTIQKHKKKKKNKVYQRTSYLTDLHYYNKDKRSSIFYFVFQNDYYFGLDKKIKDLFKKDYLSVFFSTLKKRFDIKIKKHNMKFTIDENEDIHFLMPINTDSLNFFEVQTLNKTQKIIYDGKSEYIDFGVITERNISVLRNLKNLMFKTKINHQTTKYLKLEKIFLSSEEKVFTKGICPVCNTSISQSYDKNPEIKEFAGKNPLYCAECYSKGMVKLFLKKYPNFLKNKHNLEKLSKNDFVLKFYLNLLEKFNVFDNKGRIPDELLVYEKFRDYPNVEPRLTINLNNYNFLQDILPIIDDLIPLNNFKKNDFSNIEKILYKRNLTYNDGLNIKNQIENEAISKKLYTSSKKGMETKIESRRKILIREKQKKNNLDIFKIITELNKITLNAKGEINDNFLYLVRSKNLDDETCLEIRNLLINKILEGSISEEDIKNQFNEIIDEYMLEKYKKIIQKKEFYSFGNCIHIKTILFEEDLIQFIETLDNLKDYIAIDNFHLLKINNEFFKIIIDFKTNPENMNLINSTFSDCGFEKFLFEKVI